MTGQRRGVDRATLERLVVEERKSFVESALLLSVHWRTVARKAKEYGIVSSHQRVKRDELHDAAWLAAQFADGRSIADLAEQLGVNYGTVITARRRHGIAPKRTPKRRVDVEAVRSMLDAGDSLGDIGRHLGHTSSAISKVARRYGLQRPSHS